MVLVTSNKHQKLLFLNYVQQVSVADLATARTEIAALLGDLPSGLRLLSDLSQLESMDPEGLGEIGATMDLINQTGVSLIVRVIPDPTKDIGLNILTVFHYPRHPRIITCRSLTEALRKLSLWT